MQNKTYISIDLKSFYASVECIERGLDPLKTNLVVADSNRTEKTICLAVTPSLKQYGIPGRVRLFEVVQKVKQINYERKRKIYNKDFIGKSYNIDELKQYKNLELDYIIAPPRMEYYMEYSTRVYKVYLKYFSAEDIYVYSIDGVFIDITNYLEVYKLTAKELTKKVIQDILKTTGITATAGIGTNLYLCKIAMDIVAKHIEADESGVRIAELDEMSYRRLLWNHKPITDFWRVGKGYANKLAKYRIFTMGDVARISVDNEELLYKLFGVNAELLIDHSWGWEPCTIKSIKEYKPQSNSINSGQVLHSAYSYEKTKLIVKEMAELLSLDLVSKGVVTNQLVLTVGYDIENLMDPEIKKNYNGEVTIDRYGRAIPKHAHGTINLNEYTSSTKEIVRAIIELFEKIVNEKLLTRRIYISANNLISKDSVIEEKNNFEQIDLFTNYKKINKEKEVKKEKEIKEDKIQKAMLEIKGKYGKNAIIKGMNLEKGGTTIDRNSQIGGHKK